MLCYSQPCTRRCAEPELPSAGCVESHAWERSSPCLPFISLPIQPCLPWTRIQSSHLTRMILLSFQMQDFFLQGTHLCAARFVEVIWVGSLGAIFESALADLVALSLPGVWLTAREGRDYASKLEPSLEGGLMRAPLRGLFLTPGTTLYLCMASTWSCPFISPMSP